MLRDEPDWTSDRILQAIAGDRDEVAVTLDTPIPVHLVYSTVTVTDEGDVLFFDDLYGHDARLERALARRQQRRARRCRPSYFGADGGALRVTHSCDDAQPGG